VWAKMIGTRLAKVKSMEQWMDEPGQRTAYTTGARGTGETRGDQNKDGRWLMSLLLLLGRADGDERDQERATTTITTGASKRRRATNSLWRSNDRCYLGEHIWVRQREECTRL
jgi:hypothetical protein